MLIQAGDLITDAALARSQAQSEPFWRIRSSVSEGNKKSGMSLVFDVAVPLIQVPAFIARADAAVRAICPALRVPVVGHLGEGHIHWVTVIDWAHWQSLSEPQALMQTMRDAVYAIVAELGGTWSAEHGIGRMLRKEMQQYKSPVELKLMRAIKATLDPQGLFNPGQVLPA